MGHTERKQWQLCYERGDHGNRTSVPDDSRNRVFRLWRESNFSASGHDGCHNILVPQMHRNRLAPETENRP